MTPGLGLFVVLPVVVAFLAATVLTGLRKRRRAHLIFVVGTVLGLVVAIAFAVRLGEEYDLEAAGWITPVHLGLARVATVAVLPTLVSGALVLRGRGRLAWHRGFVRLLVGLILLSAITGGWMILGAEPI